MVDWKAITSSRLRGLKRRDRACSLSLDEFRTFIYEVAQRPTVAGDDGAVWRCHYCEEFLNLSDLTLDHYIPLDRGGRTITDNLTPCCSPCNEIKATLCGESYIKFRKFLVTLPADERASLTRRLRRGGRFFHSKRKVQASA
jgi:hypothetical protein